LKKEYNGMLICNRWQAKAAFIMASSMVTAIATPIAAQAQFSMSGGHLISGEHSMVRSQTVRSHMLLSQTLFDSARVSIPAGTSIQT
jgi:hypothetical protein